MNHSGSQNNLPGGAVESPDLTAETPTPWDFNAIAENVRQKRPNRETRTRCARHTGSEVERSRSVGGRLLNVCVCGVAKRLRARAALPVCARADVRAGCVGLPSSLRRPRG